MSSTLVGLKPFGSSGKKTRYPYSRFQAQIFKIDGTIISTDTAAAMSLVGRETSDVISADTWKTVASPMGTYTVVLVPRRIDYFEEVYPGDWCQIIADNGDGRGLVPLMYGPIINVRKRTSVGAKGETKTNVILRGADFGRAFSMTTAIYDAKLADDPAFSNLGLARLVQDLKTVSDTPGNIVRALLTRFYAADLKQWIDPKFGETFGAVDLDLDYIDQNLPGNAVVQPFKLAGSMWETLRQWANVSMNEMFVDFRPPFSNQNDLVNLVPALVLRQYPFYGDAWKNLTSVYVSKDEVVSEDLGKSEADVKNWIRSTDEPSLTGIRGGLVVYLDKVGTVNPESIKKFGFRRHELTTQYILDKGGGDDPPKSIPDIMQLFTGYQTMWYHSNERLIDGTLNTYFRPDIRVGYRLDYEDVPRQKTLQFYVQGVGHQLVYPGASTTTVHLVRGQDPTDPLFLADADKLIADGVIEQLGDTMDRVGSLLK